VNKQRVKQRTYPDGEWKMLVLGEASKTDSLEIVTPKDVSSAHVSEHTPVGPLEGFQEFKFWYVGIAEFSLSANSSLISVAFAGQGIHWRKVLEVLEGVPEACLG